MEEKITVLVIEDFVQAREALCAVLESNGFDVHCCGDGESALSAAAHNEFEVIITDYRMPNMNGVEVTRRLRTRFPGSIIIGVSSDHVSEAFLAAGADVFLLKPYRYSELVNLLRVRR